jgi:hypothetical protein
MALSIQEIIEALKIVDGLKKQIEDAVAKVKTHYAEVEDEERRKAIMDACDRRDTDFIRSHIFTD